MRKYARTHLWLIRFIGLIVPERLRADWRQEWNAELRYRETLLAEWNKLDWKYKWDLLRRSLGAFWDALVLQPQRLEDEMFQDLRFGLRMLIRHKGFTLTTVLMLALGIGASTTMFSVVDAALFRPLPFAAPERLVEIDRAGALYNLFGSGDSEFMAAREPVDVFEQVAAYEGGKVNLTDAATPERVAAMRTTASFFPLLGVNPMLGRTFAATEQQAGQNRVVVVSYELWQRRFGGDPNVLNKPVKLSGHTFTVIGVMPRTFRFVQWGVQAEMWLPLTPGEDLFAAEAIFYNVSGRLRAGLSLAQAQAQVEAAFERVWQRDPQHKPEDRDLSRVRLIPLQQRFSGDLRTPLLLLLGAVGCVLLLACANAANLFLARAAARQKEIAIRASLGAGRLRLMRQWLTESTLLASLGGVAGVWMAMWGVKAVVRLNPIQLPLMHDVEINGRVLIFAVVVSLLTGWLFGLAPTWQASRPDVSASLKDGGQRSASGPSPRLRNLLTIAEVALSLLLLAGAGLLIKSFQYVLNVPPGFNPQNVLTAELTPPQVKYPKREDRAFFYQQVLESIRALPGIQFAGLTNTLPLAPESFIIVPVELAGRETVTEWQASGALRTASPDYFHSLQIPLLAGRFFSEHDTADRPPVIIINRTLSRRLFGEANPLGQQVTLMRKAEKIYQIVGVVGDLKNRGLELMNDAEFYLPVAQRAPNSARLTLRTYGNPIFMSAAMRQAVWKIDREQPVHNIKTMEQHFAASLADRRFAMTVLSLFAATALMLAALGLYGVMSYAVTQRTHEFGIRMALGAQTGDVLQMVLCQGMRLTLIGVGLGLGASLALTRLIKSLLFNVSVTDPLTFIEIALLLIVVAFIASYVPAHRATKVDPLTALRHE